MAYKKVLVGSTAETTARSSFLKCKLCICKPPSFRTLQRFGQTAEVKSQLGTGGIWNGKLSYSPHRPATDGLPFSSKVSPSAGSVKTGLAQCECPSVRDTVKTLQEGGLCLPLFPGHSGQQCPAAAGYPRHPLRLLCGRVPPLRNCPVRGFPSVTQKAQFWHIPESWFLVPLMQDHNNFSTLQRTTSSRSQPKVGVRSSLLPSASMKEKEAYGLQRPFFFFFFRFWREHTLHMSVRHLNGPSK